MDTLCERQRLENHVPDAVVDLLSWLLISSKTFTVKCEPHSVVRILEFTRVITKFQPILKFEELQKKTGRSSYKIRPDFVFKVEYQDSGKFSSQRGTFGTFYAYHGSRLENFHSILHHGLISHLNKVNKR
jgi:hypothetical protein